MSEVRVRIAVCERCPARFVFVNGHVDPQPDEVVMVLSPLPGDDMGTVMVHKVTCPDAVDPATMPVTARAADQVLGRNS